MRNHKNRGASLFVNMAMLYEKHDYSFYFNIFGFS